MFGFMGSFKWLGYGAVVLIAVGLVWLAYRIQRRLQQSLLERMCAREAFNGYSQFDIAFNVYQVADDFYGIEQDADGRWVVTPLQEAKAGPDGRVHFARNFMQEIYDLLRKHYLANPNNRNVNARGMIMEGVLSEPMQRVVLDTTVKVTERMLNAHSSDIVATAVETNVISADEQK
jgi:DTW domain-containing protein YfiP